MNVWEAYEHRIKHTVSEIRTKSRITHKLPDSLSYETVTIDGEDRNVAVIDSDNYTEKTLLSLPGEHFLGGELVYFAEDYWLVTSVDARQDVYARAKMEQCNHVLKWIAVVAGEPQIIECNCIVEDGTKYLTGETTSNYAENGMVLGDTRISVRLPRNEYTTALGRTNRFLIDDEDTGHVLSYRITKPFKIGGVYKGHGVMAFVMQECNTEDVDNVALHLADYYKYFPKNTESGDADSGGKKVWL